MPWQNVPGREHIHSWPYQHDHSALAQGAFYTYGSGGDENPGTRATSGDPGNCQVDPVITNTGTVDIYVGTDLISMMLDDEATVIEPDAPPQVLPGELASLIVYNAVGSGAVATWGVHSKLSRRLNEPARNAGHPGHAREHTGIVEAVPNGTGELDITALWALQTTGIWLWAPGTPTSAAGTYIMAVKKNDTANMLSGASFNLETLSAGVAKKDIGLSGTPADLQLDAGDTINIDAISDNVDLVDGDFAVLIAATKL